MALLLSKNDVMNVLEMNDVIEKLGDAFRDLSEDNALMPQRTPITVPQHTGLALFMPAYLKGMGALGIKTVTVYKDNPKKFKMPTILGTILILDEKTGEPLAVMDGGYLTGVRTGAVAGLATKYLSRHDASTHVLFGSGGMAVAQAFAIDAVRNIERLIIYSLDSNEVKEAFVNSLKGQISSEIIIADDPEEAVKMADIVTLITSAKDPIVDGAWFQPGTHINGMGSHAPGMRELDVETISRSKVVCALVEACQSEAGDFIIPVNAGEWNWNKVHGSLGDIVTGKIRNRESNEEITLFKSVGLAIQDISIAFSAYEKAKERNIGTDFNFSG